MEPANVILYTLVIWCYLAANISEDFTRHGLHARGATFRIRRVSRPIQHFLQSASRLCAHGPPQTQKKFKYRTGLCSWKPALWQQADAGPPYSAFSCVHTASHPTFLPMLSFRCPYLGQTLFVSVYGGIQQQEHAHCCVALATSDAVLEAARICAARRVHANILFVLISLTCKLYFFFPFPHIVSHAVVLFRGYDTSRLCAAMGQDILSMHGCRSRPQMSF